MTGSVKIKPDYDTQCTACAQSPTVVIDNDNLDLCGPCTFGEAAMIDVDNWPKTYVETSSNE